MIELKKQAAKVANINVRNEIHGKDPILAADIKLEVELPNMSLDRLAEGLRDALYGPSDEAQLPGVETPPTALRWPQLAPLRWDAGELDCALTLHGAKRANDLDLEGKITNPLSLTLKEGGTVETTIQVQVHPTPESLGALSAFLGHKVNVTLLASAAPEQPPLE